MKTPSEPVHFFMGSNTANGFVSYFEDLQKPESQNRLLLLKGGPGTGKSTLMKRISNNHDGFIEQIHCASDPDSLDAVILPATGQVIVDATPPHALEPRYPLAVEQLLDLASSANLPAMRQKRAEIVPLTDLISSHHKRFCSLLKSANLLYDNNRAIISPYIDRQKLIRQTLKIADRHFKKAAKGSEQRRLLSAFTPKGLVRFEDTLHHMCDEVLVLHDETRVCAPMMLSILRKRLLEEDIAFYSLYSPYDAKNELEGLIVPSVGFGVITVTKALPYQYDAKMLHTTRFIDKEIFRIKKQRLSFCRKTAEALLEEAIFSLKKAKEAHDCLEDLYRPHMDFSVANDAYQKLSEKDSTFF